MGSTPVKDFEPIAVTVYRSLIIDAPIDVVWSAIRAFDQVDKWNPGVADAWMESGGNTDIGGVRHLATPDGDLFVETLLAHSDDDHLYTYRIDQSPLAATDYVATHQLQPVTEGNQTFSSWTAEFGVRPGDEERMDHIVGDNIFVNGMKGLADFVVSNGLGSR